MGIFDDLYRSFQAQERVSGISPDFKPSQVTPNVYTPIGYPTLERVSQQAQSPYSFYAPPSEINMDTLSAYGRQLSGQRPTTPYAPVDTPVTDKLAQDTLNKLVGAKIARMNSVYQNVQAGNRPNMPAIRDALSTANALNDY